MVGEGVDLRWPTYIPSPITTTTPNIMIINMSSPKNADVIELTLPRGGISGLLVLTFYRHYASDSSLVAGMGIQPT